MSDAMASQDFGSFTTFTSRIGIASDGQKFALAHGEKINFKAGQRTGICTYECPIENGTVASISFHAAQRTVQRANVRNISDLIDEVGREFPKSADGLI